MTLTLYLLSDPRDPFFVQSPAPGERDPLWLLLALAFPAVIVNLGQGHNGFLTAALFGAALASSNAGR